MLHLVYLDVKKIFCTFYLSRLKVCSMPGRRQDEVPYPARYPSAADLRMSPRDRKALALKLPRLACWKGMSTAGGTESSMVRACVAMESAGSRAPTHGVTGVHRIGPTSSYHLRTVISCVIDIDDQDTWPPEVLAGVARLAERLRGTTQYTADLAIDPDEEDEFRLLFAGHAIRAYHATRLLPHEVEGIRNEGLRPLSVAFIEERLDAARTCGVLPEDLANVLRQSHMLTRDDIGARDGQVCLFLSRDLFEEDHGFGRLFGTWGGEAVYFGVSNEQTAEHRLRMFGQPALVVATLDSLSEGWREHLVAPGVAHAFVGEFLGLENRGADIHYRRSIPGSAIEDIWQPGHPSFDHHLGWAIE